MVRINGFVMAKIHSIKNNFFFLILLIFILMFLLSLDIRILLFVSVCEC